MTLVRVSAERRPSPIRDPFLKRPSTALFLWVALIAIASVWGVILLWRRAPLSSIDAPPLFGHLGLILSPGILLALLVSALALVWTPKVAERLSWPWAVFAVAMLGLAWTVSLTFAASPREIIRPVVGANEYLHDLPRVGNPILFLHQFVSQIDTFSTHVRAHPPGMLLFLWLLAKVGLRGPWPAAFAMIAGGAAAVAAAMVAIRELALEDAARKAGPFLALAPAAIWIATSADAFYAGVSAWAITLIILGTCRRGRGSSAYAVGGGVLFGAAVMLSYGSLALLGVPVLVAISRRRVRPLVLAGFGLASVILLFKAMGFSWVTGFFATRHQYEIFYTHTRPYSYFLVANLAAFAVALGPAIGRSLSTLKHGGVWLLVAGGLVAAVLSDLSGLSKGEVERIWLPFAPWVLASAAGLDDQRHGWLACQVGLGLVLACFLRTAW